MARIHRAIPALTKQAQERFWKKVDRSPGYGPDGDCWIWIAGAYGGKYGGYRIGDEIHYAHRIAFALTCGHIDPSLDVCHTCDNPLCCNPAHLWQGTRRQNLQDMAAKGRHWMNIHPQRIRRGDNNGHTKIPDAEIPRIKAEYAQGIATRKQLAARYGVSKSCIDQIVTNRSRKHL